MRAEQEAACGDALAVAHQGLNDREPEATDTRLSLADQDARTGKHGDYSEGYLLAVSRDADSELICAVEVLPANGDEAANAPHLIASEGHAHGNAVASLSVDRLGYRGDVRAELSEAADGPHLTVYVPPIDWTHPAPELFQPADFTLSKAGDEVHCPGGATTGTRKRTKRGHGWHFRCRTSQCRTCPVRAQCLKPDTQGGRTVDQERLRSAVPRSAAARADSRISGYTPRASGALSASWRS